MTKRTTVLSQNIITTIENFLWKNNFEYTINSEGCNNVVYEIEDSYILRISKNPSENFDKELCILNLMKDFKEFSLPKILLHWDKKERMLYTKIPGKNLDNTIISSLSPQIYQSIVEKIVSFLVSFHQLYTHREIIKKWITTYDKSRIHKDKLKRITIKDIKIRTLADNLINMYEEDWNKNNNSKLWLLHNDLYEKNIFIKPDLSDISWIIDFGDCTIADIHNEFTFLYHPNNNFRSDVIDVYVNKTWIHINKEQVVINAKIFLILWYIEDPNRFAEWKLWIDKR
jgi:aminoglycoside phosphotransferase (APT) family kinase protein